MNLITKAVVAVNIALALLGAFLMFKGVDEATFNGVSAVVIIEQVPSSLTKDAALRTIESAATGANLTVAKMVADPDNIEHGRIIYTFAGEPTAAYTPFSADMSTKVLPISALGTADLRGTYFAEGSESSTAAFIRTLQSAGLTVSFENRNPAAYAVGGVIDEPGMLSLVLVAQAGMALALVYQATQARKALAIKTVHGASEGEVIRDELAALGRYFGLATAGAIAGGSILLFTYNQFAQLAEFVGIVAVALLVTAASAAGMYWLALLLLPSASLPNLMKGKRPLGYLAAVAVIVHVLMTASLYQALTRTVANTNQAIAASAQLENWRADKDLLTIRFGPHLERSQYEALRPAFDRIVHQQDAAGDLVVAVHPTDPIPGEYGPDAGNSLIVNNVYLDRQTILDASGDRIGPIDAAQGELTLLIPSTLEEQTDAIIDTYVRYFKFQLELSATETGRTDPPLAVVVHTISTQPGQRIFNYGGTAAMRETSQLDPVIAVLPAATGLLSSDFYLATASSGGILFDDPDTTIRLLDQAGISPHLASIDRAADYALAEIQQLHANVRALQVAIVLTMSLLVFASFVLVSTYAEATKQVIFTKHTQGWSFRQTHWPYLAGLILLSCAATGWAMTWAAQASGGLGWAGAVIIAAVLLHLPFLKLYDHRLRADLIKRD